MTIPKRSLVTQCACVPVCLSTSLVVRRASLNDSVPDRCSCAICVWAAVPCHMSLSYRTVEIIPACQVSSDSIRASFLFVCAAMMAQGTRPTDIRPYSRNSVLVLITCRAEARRLGRLGARRQANIQAARQTYIGKPLSQTPDEALEAHLQLVLPVRGSAQLLRAGCKPITSARHRH